MVELETTRPALYIQNAESTQRTRIHFSAGKTVSTLTPFGGPEATLRGSGAEPLSADAKD
jgi:hypothetical protein